jgi:molybdopterin synthase sulfur carrier subunit
MVRVLFFARLREELDCASLDIPWSDRLADLDALCAALCEHGGERWRQLLGQQNIIRAVNHKVAEGNCTLRDGDEVAFFPPVTGG